MHLTLSHLRVFIMLAVFFSLYACNSLRPVTSETRSTSDRRRTSPSSDRDEIRDKITSYALQQEGAKYKYGAKGPKHFDCSGFTCFVYANQNIALPGGSYNQARLGKKVPLSEAQPGDLIFFGKGSKVNHVALIVRNSSSGIEVIHSTSSSGVIRQNVSQSSYWKQRILYVRNVIDG